MTGTPPLDGLRVIDFSRYAPGPFATMMLSDFGADVVWIESPDDTSRGRDWDGSNPLGRYELNPLCRNKRSIVIDLKQDAGAELTRALIASADVVVEQFRPGVMERLGLGYREMSKANRGLVYCSITGYGLTGDRSSRPGHDLNFLALSGMLDLLLAVGQSPTVPGNVIGDIAGGGLGAAIGILLALRHRDRTGLGQIVEVSMTDSVVSMLGGLLSAQQSGADIRPGQHRLTGGSPRYNVYRSRSGRWVALGGSEPHFWERVCMTLGLPLSPEPTYEQVAVAVAATEDEVLESLGGECVTLVATLAEALEDARLFERGALTRIPAGPDNTVVQAGVVPRLHATPGRITDLGEAPGSSTLQLLADLGYAVADIEELLQDGVIRYQDRVGGRR